MSFPLSMWLVQKVDYAKVAPSYSCSLGFTSMQVLPFKAHRFGAFKAQPCEEQLNDGRFLLGQALWGSKLPQDPSGATESLAV